MSDVHKSPIDEVMHDAEAADEPGEVSPELVADKHISVDAKEIDSQPPAFGLSPLMAFPRATRRVRSFVCVMALAPQVTLTVLIFSKLVLRNLFLLEELPSSILRL